jgi:hypothetical protein
MDGSEKIGLSAADPGHLVEDDAEIKDVPPGAVYMECQGTPAVVIRLRDKDVASQRKSVNILLPGALEASPGLYRWGRGAPAAPLRTNRELDGVAAYTVAA